MSYDFSESPTTINSQDLEDNFSQLVSHRPNQLPPHNLEAEEGILGGILLDPQAIHLAIASGLTEKTFYYPDHATIFKTAKALHDGGMPTDLNTVCARLYDRDRLVQIGGQAKLAWLVDCAVPTILFESYIKTLNEKAWQRELATLSKKINILAHDRTIPIEAARGWIDSQVSKATASPLIANNSDPKNSADYHSYNRIITQLRSIEFEIEQAGYRYFCLQKLAKAHKMNLSNLTELYAASQADHITGKSYTLAELIKKYGQQERQWLMTGILPKQGLTVLHAAGGVGKTRLAYNLACNLIMSHDWGDFNVTGSNQRILIYQTDETMGNTISTLREMGMDVNNPNIRVVDHWNFDAIPQLIKEIDEWKPTMVIIDSITSNNWQSPHEESKAAYAKPLLVLKDVAQGIRSRTNPEHPDQGLAWGHKTSFLVIHHSNVEGRARGTTAIVNSATQVISIKKVQEHSDLGVLVFEKSRDKVTEKILIKSDPETKKWEVLNTEYDGKPVALTGEYLGGDLEHRQPESMKAEIVNFLRQNPNVKFTIQELQNEIGGDKNYMRAVCGRLASTGRIERKPGLEGHANLYYFAADIDFSLKDIKSNLRYPHDHPPDHEGRITPLDHPQNSDLESDSSEPDLGDPQKSKNSKIINFKKPSYTTPDHEGSAETNTEIEKEGDTPPDDHPDHPLYNTILPKIERNPEIDPNMVQDPEMDKLRSEQRLRGLLAVQQEKFALALKIARLEELDAALGGMRSQNSDRAKQIKARIEEIVSGQPNLIT